MIDWNPRIATPILIRRLADEGLTGKKKLQRAQPGELYRATCEFQYNEGPEGKCDWTGDWHSVWNKWETLLEECNDDYLQHMLVTHGNNNSLPDK